MTTAPPDPMFDVNDKVQLVLTGRTGWVLMHEWASWRGCYVYTVRFRDGADLTVPENVLEASNE